MPVTVNSETFKKALSFLVDHNYSFDQPAHEMDGDKSVINPETSVSSDDED